MAFLQTNMTQDIRMSDFQYCLSPDNSVLTSFRIALAKDYGKAAEITEMSRAGPGTANCKGFYKITEPVTSL